MKKSNNKKSSYLRKSVKINTKNLEKSKNLKKSIATNIKEAFKAKSVEKISLSTTISTSFMLSYEERYDSYADRIAHAIVLNLVAPYNPDEL
jgi:N-methylhydantoinase A/oxoprolinase/acetone carboxylase beta subunit